VPRKAKAFLEGVKICVLYVCFKLLDCDVS
jgi:hypothetical protein